MLGCHIKVCMLDRMVRLLHQSLHAGQDVGLPHQSLHAGQDGMAVTSSLHVRQDDSRFVDLCLTGVRVVSVMSMVLKCVCSCWLDVWFSCHRSSAWFMTWSAIYGDGDRLPSAYHHCFCLPERKDCSGRLVQQRRYTFLPTVGLPHCMLAYSWLSVQFLYATVSYKLCTVFNSFWLALCSVWQILTGLVQCATVFDWVCTLLVKWGLMAGRTGSRKHLFCFFLLLFWQHIVWIRLMWRFPTLERCCCENQISTAINTITAVVTTTSITITTTTAGDTLTLEWCTVVDCEQHSGGEHCVPMTNVWREWGLVGRGRSGRWGPLGPGLVWIGLLDGCGGRVVVVSW